MPLLFVFTSKYLKRKRRRKDSLGGIARRKLRNPGGVIFVAFLGEDGKEKIKSVIKERRMD